MRVSTIGSFQRGLSMIQQLQSAMDRTQRQVSSGRRILTPSDDPVASSRALGYKEVISRLGQFERNANNAQSRLSFEESALKSVGDVMQRVRELALQANNATQSNESRGLIAVEIGQQLDSLLQLANQQDGNGRYLFSGNMDGTAAVSKNANTYSYNGDQGQRLIQIGESRQIPDGDSGYDVFFQVRNGNGIFSTSPAPGNIGNGVLGAGSVLDQSQYDQDQYTIRFTDPDNYEVVDSSAGVIASGSFQSGDAITFRGIQVQIDGGPATGDEFVVSPSTFQNVFSVVDELRTAIETIVSDDSSRAELNNGINAGILEIDQAIGKMLEIRTQVGSRLAAIDSQEDANAATVLTLQGTLAAIEDLDYAEALSRLTLQATTLEAAQQSFIRTRNLSLFNYF